MLPSTPSHTKDLLSNLGSLLSLLPTFILIAFLVCGLNWELTGGILIALTGLAATPFIYNLNFQRTQSVSTSLGVILMITLPLIIIGALFIISYFINRKTGVSEPQ
jgi:glycerol-3-phosphate acyltransferase PlsY